MERQILSRSLAEKAIVLLEKLNWFLLKQGYSLATSPFGVRHRNFKVQNATGR
jgi:hypothetical protein